MSQPQCPHCKYELTDDDIMVAGELMEQMYRNDLKELGHENNNNR